MGYTEPRGFSSLFRRLLLSYIIIRTPGVSFKNWLDDFFMAKPEDFFKCGIKILPKRWEAVVNNGGEYITD
jgi:hypothetical protein